MNKALNVVLTKISDLHFDYENPRLAEYGINEATPEDEILKILWEAMDVRELVQSISASGFFSHEALIVAKEDGRNIVIERNRRLAAVKVLLGGDKNKELGWAVPALSIEARAALKPFQRSSRRGKRLGVSLGSSMSTGRRNGVATRRLPTSSPSTRRLAFPWLISPTRSATDITQFNVCIAA